MLDMRVRPLCEVLGASLIISLVSSTLTSMSPLQNCCFREDALKFNTAISAWYRPVLPTFTHACARGNVQFLLTIQALWLFNSLVNCAFELCSNYA